MIIPQDEDDFSDADWDKQEQRLAAEDRQKRQLDEDEGGRGRKSKKSRR